jgi:hypothetical protein
VPESRARFESLAGPAGTAARAYALSSLGKRAYAASDPTYPRWGKHRSISVVQLDHAIALADIAIDDDLLIAVRARGHLLEWHTMFGDGTPFGGGGGWLPTAQRASLLERATLWLSGHRGSVVTFTRDT